MTSLAHQMNGHTDVWVQTPEGSVFARVWSSGRSAERAPIVLLHDSLGCVDLWRDFPAALGASTGRTVIAYDRRGFGRSDAHAGTLRPTFVADEAETTFMAVRERLGIERFVVFGHSVGGGMAVNCAARYDEACTAVISEAAQARVEEKTLQGIRQAKELFSNEDQLNRLRRLHGDKAPWVLEAWTGTWLSPAFASWSIEEVLPRVKCPVLAIHGTEDEYGSVRNAELIARLVAGPARQEIMPDTRHVPHRERQPAVLGMVADFLRPLP